MEPETCKAMVWRYIQKNPNSSASTVSLKLGIGKAYCQNIIRDLISIGCLHQTGGEGKSNNPRLLSIVEGKQYRSHTSDSDLLRSRKFAKGNHQKLWNNMKIEQSFTARSITASVDIKEATAHRFITQLLKAGYLERIINSRKVIKNRFSYRYRLIRDTGRLAPKLRKNGLWDMNEERFYSYARVAQNRTEAHYDVAR
jgi:predicted HTH transcriptional regulator